jgi:hypothetical protein
MKKIIILIVLILVVISTHSKPSQSSYFDIAEQRIEKYNPKRKDLVIIVDYRKNIFSERIFVLDMKKKEIILSENVSHAWNSGFLFPKSYSNTPGTYKSSKGTFITRGTRYGSYGYSMIIDGLDHGVNNNTKSRYILFHSNAKTKTKWSAGCFSTSEHINKKIIDLTKGGVLVCVID